MGAPQHSDEPAQKADKDPLPGTVVNGKYRVISVLARGGMGKIYRAEQVPLGRPVALKVLRTRYTDDERDDPQFQKRFFLEASILSKLQHGNIVTLFDYGRIEGVEGEQFFMAMELLRGQTLAHALRANGALAPRDALRVVRQIAKGLREAHKQGVIHRDLKPSNIMIVPDEDGQEVVKILDFGIGKVLNEGGDSQQELTAEGAFLGSPRYMAPEQINEGRVDIRTDVYSLGVILYECLAGRVPFEGDTNINTMMAHCNSPVPRMRDRSDAEVPEALEAFARHCLEKDAVVRPQTMEAFMRELNHVEEFVFGAPLSMSGSSGVLSSVRHPDSAPSNPTPVTGDGPTMSSNRFARFDSRPSRSSGPPSIVGSGTHRSLTRSQFPANEQAAARKRNAVIAFVAAAVLLAGAGLAVFFATRPSTTASTTPSATEATPPAGATAYALRIESSPPGAEVLEGEKSLGKTPLSLSVEHASVASGARKFVLRMEGYDDFTLTQGDSDTSVRFVAPLVRTVVEAPPSATATLSAAPAPTPTPTRQGNVVAVRPPPPPPTSSPATTSQQQSRPPPEPDIKLKR